MKRVVDGLLNKQIAAELGTSETTVKIHRHQVMEKTLPELVRMADRLESLSQSRSCLYQSKLEVPALGA
jgi:FixJ family two-component response regulator